MPNLLKKPKQTPFPKETPPKRLQQLTKQKTSNDQKRGNKHEQQVEKEFESRIEREVLLHIPMLLCWLNGYS